MVLCKLLGGGWMPVAYHIIVHIMKSKFYISNIKVSPVELYKLYWIKSYGHLCAMYSELRYSVCVLFTLRPNLASANLY